MVPSIHLISKPWLSFILTSIQHTTQKHSAISLALSPSQNQCEDCRHRRNVHPKSRSHNFQFTEEGQILWAPREGPTRDLHPADEDVGLWTWIGDALRGACWWRIAIVWRANRRRVAHKSLEARHYPTRTSMNSSWTQQLMYATVETVYVFKAGVDSSSQPGQRLGSLLFMVWNYVEEERHCSLAQVLE